MKFPTHSARAPLAAAAACLTAVFLIPPASAQSLQLTEVSRFNLNAVLTAASGTAAGSPPNTRYIGNNATAVAWNGSRLFVGGFNNGATGTNSQNTGIIEVLNSSTSVTTGVVISTAVQYGNRFGFFATPTQRGYSGLALSGSRLFAALDTGVVQPNALAGYDITSSSTTSTLWSVSGRGNGGVAIDPGYVVAGTNQGGAGVGWATWGDSVVGSANRRGLNDPATGATIYGFSSTGTAPAGMQWTATTNAVNGRDITFDPRTGDVYGRYTDVVSKAVRNGPNSTTAQSVLWDPLDNTITVGQNIAFLSDTSTGGDLLVFNQKDGFPNGLFTDYVRLSNTSGVIQPATWTFLGGTTPTSTAGYYDFAYDETTKTVAIADASNSRVSIFKFGAPDPDTQLTWAADGVNAGGTGTWTTTDTTWIGAYGPSVWQPQANALFSGTITPSPTVTVASGGVSVGRGLSFTANGYTLAAADATSVITLTGVASSTNNIFVNTGLTATINTSLAASSGLSKSGGGALVVGGTVSGGPLFVNSGRLVVAPTAAIQSSPGISILATGTLDVTQIAGGYVLPAGTGIAGAGTVAGSITVGGSATVSPGSNLGSMTVTQDASLAAGGNYNWQITSGSGVAGSAWDLLTVGGSLTIAATPLNPFAINLWSLASAGPDVNGNATNFDSTQNYTWTIASATGGISGFAADKFVVRTSATNGTAGFSNSVGGGTFSLAQSGNSLNLVFTAGVPTVITINVASGTQTQTAAGYPTLTGTVPVIKTGAGTLVVDQANTLTGSTTIQGGRLQLANATALAASRVVPLAGGTLTLSPYLQTAVGGLAPLAGGLTDVGSGLVTVASGLSAADLVTAILTGMGDGSWNGTSGITSSVAATSGGMRTIGWLDNGDGSVTFAFAAPGDTNVDWMIDSLDQANFLAGGKLDTGLPASWMEGDFTYDGFVDILDAAAFTATGLFDKGAYNPPPAAAGVAAVPEPASLALAAAGLAAAAALAIRRRPRRPTSSTATVTAAA